MPISFSSPPRNLFLLGSSGADVVTNFFKTIDRSAGTDGVYLPDEIRYNYSDEKFILAGTAQDSNSKEFGWFEKRNYAAETGGSIADFENRIEATQTNVDTTLRAMELDSNDNLIVVGKTGSVPWIAKYSNGGVIDWQSTTNSADVEYTGVTSDSNGNYYACGSTPTTGEAQAFVEKFDASGNPGWGKSAFMLGRDVVLEKIAANSRGEVVAVGLLQDDEAYKGYIVKIDTNTGEVLWDRTLRSYEPDVTFGYTPVFCEGVFIDSKDQIYVVGRYFGISESRAFIVKYTAEGNMVWQKETPVGENIEYYEVKSDGDTEQTVVFGRYFDSVNNDWGGILSKYSKDGTLVWRRTLLSSYQTSNYFGQAGGNGICLDADPSFYYLLYFDAAVDGLNGTPESYTFGKVSGSGNGLGSFEYEEGTGEVIYYDILNVQDKIGRLSDGSLQNNKSDLITYPFNGTKILFDDLATQVANKKRQMDSADSFEYSGSPAIRISDFNLVTNLLGDTYSGSGDWLDQSGNGVNGSISGADWNAIGYWDFVPANFDGISISRNDFTSGGNIEFSIETWFKFDTLPTFSSSKGYIWDQRSTEFNGVLFKVGLDNKFTTSAYPSDIGSSILTVTSTDDATTGNWYHAVTVVDTNKVTLYIDGQIKGESTGTMTSVATTGLSSFWFGRNAAAGETMDGQIADVRIYQKALTAAQVFQNYNATKTKYLNEAPSIAPKIGPGIVYDSNLLLNYDFGNKVTYNTYRVLADIKFDTTRITNTKQTLTSVVFDADSNYGSDVAIGGGKIAVGSNWVVRFNGAVYIYDLDGTNEIKLSPTSDRFGNSVAIGHDKLVVGAPYDGGTGAVYIYDLDGSNETKITASDGASSDYFGWSVAVGNDKIVVGAYGDDDNGSLSGSVYVYDLDGSNETKITASDGASNDRFGQAVAVGDNKIVVGAPRSGNIGSGVYVYDLDGTNEVKLNPETGTDDRFGNSVAIGDGKLVVGVNLDNNQELLLLETGSVYIYNIHDLTENPIKIYASDLAANRNFGTSVAVGDNKIVVGANNGLLGSSFNDESVYVYDLDGTNEVKLGNYIGGNAVAIKDGIILTGNILDDEASLFSYLTPLPTTVKNLSSSSYTGTINGATFNSAGYFEFNNNSWISFSALSVSTFTYEGWVYSTPGGLSTEYGYLFSGGSFGLAISEGGDAGIGLATGDMYYYNSSVAVGLDVNIPANQWKHVVAVVNGTAKTIVIFINGVEQIITPTVNVTNTQTSITDLGRYRDGNTHYWNGRRGEERIYNRALTSTEISQNFNATRAKYGV